MLTYEQYREEWLKRHPGSIPAEVEIISEYPTWVKIMVGGMFVSSAAISGVHTAPIVRLAIEQSVAGWVADIAAGLSFVAIELGLFVSAYLRRKNGILAIIILLITMVVAISANVVSVMKALSANGETSAGTVANILGIAIPLLSAAAGEMFVHITSAGREERLAAERQRREELKQLDAIIGSAYRKYEKETSAQLSERTDARTDARTDTGLLSDGNVRSDTDTDGHGRTSHAGFGHKRTPDGQQKALDWFDANPDKVGMSLRDLEPITGLGRDTLSRARRQWQQARAEQPEVSANGTGAE